MRSTTLHLAVALQDEPAVRSLLANGASVAAKNENGENCLHLAVRSGNRSIVRTLVNEGLRGGQVVNLVGKDKFTALHIAAEMDNVEMAELLLASGAKANTANRLGDSPLHEAVANGSASMARLLLDHSADPNHLNHCHQSPFHESFQNPDDGLTRLFLAFGASPRLKNGRGENSLHLASARSRRRTIEALLGFGIDVNQRTLDGSTALLLAIGNPALDEGQKLKVARSLVDRGADVRLGNTKRRRGALYETVERGHAELAEWLLAEGADVDGAFELCRRPQSPLAVALENHDAGVVRLLLRHGADVNLKDDSGRSSLHIAIESFDDQSSLRSVVELLLGRGAKVNSRDSANRTALHCAIQKRHEELAHFLLDEGAAVRAKDTYHESVLHFAVRYRCKSVAKRLVELGAGVNDVNARKKSVLALAAESECEDTMKLLLDNKANPSDGLAVNSVAVWGNVRIMEMLRAKGADLRSFHLVLDYAVYRGSLDMVAYLLSRGARITHGGARRSILCSIDRLHGIYGGELFFRSKYYAILKLLAREFALLAARNFYVNECSRKLLESHGVMRPVHEKCLGELEKMKRTRSRGDSAVTYFELLVKRHDALVRCLASRKVYPAFEEDSSELKKSFPTYFSRLASNVRSGEVRCRAILRLESILSGIFYPVVPREITDKIARYLSNADLKSML